MFLWLMENLWTGFDEECKTFDQKQPLYTFTKSLNLIMREGGNISGLKALYICTAAQLWTTNGSDWALCDVVFSGQL